MGAFNSSKVTVGTVQHDGHGLPGPRHTQALPPQGCGRGQAQEDDRERHLLRQYGVLLHLQESQPPGRHQPPLLPAAVCRPQSGQAKVQRARDSRRGEDHQGREDLPADPHPHWLRGAGEVLPSSLADSPRPPRLLLLLLVLLVLLPLLPISKSLARLYSDLHTCETAGLHLRCGRIL